MPRSSAVSSGKEWRDTECIVIGGGFRASRIGELAIGRSAVLLKADGIPVDIELIRNDPDEAGLIGGAHLAAGMDAEGARGLLAVDVGGTNIRAGLIELNLKKGEDLAKRQCSLRAVAPRRRGDQAGRRRRAAG